MGCKPNYLLLATSPTIGFRDADAWMPAYIHTIDQSPTFWAGVENEKKRRFMRQVERVRHAWEFCKFFNFPSVFQSSLYKLADPREPTPDPRPHTVYQLPFSVSGVRVVSARAAAHGVVVVVICRSVPGSRFEKAITACAAPRIRKSFKYLDSNDLYSCKSSLWLRTIS